MHVCRGRITFGDIADRVAQFYDGEPTSHVLWDFSAANTESFTAADVGRLVEFVKARAHSRAGGRTAVVTPEDATFGLGRMYQTLAELAEQIAEVQVFRSTASARSWIGS